MTSLQSNELVQSTDDDVKEILKESPSVLPADHPLLERFQSALKTHLQKISDDLIDEIQELDYNFKQMEMEYEDVGSNVYDLQQQIEQQKNCLDDLTNQIKDLTEKRIKHETNASTLKKSYDLMNRTYKDQKLLETEHIMKLKNLQTLENNIKKWTDEIRNDVDASKRIVSKDNQDQLTIAEEKKQMDLILFNLDTEVRKCENDLENLTEQTLDQDEVVEILKKSLADANSDLDALQQEHKRLMLSWNEVIIAIQKRDKILGSLKDGISDEDKHQKVLQASIDSTKKTLNKETIQNLSLEAFRIRLTEDVGKLEKQLSNQETESQKLLDENDQLTQLLEQTESDLSRASKEGIIIENQLKTFTRRVEKQSEEKVHLEEKVLVQLQDKMSTNQANQARIKILKDIQEKRRTMEIAMLATEQQLSQVLFNLEKWKEIVANNKETVNKMTKNRENETLRSNKLTEEINKVKQTINVKLHAFDLLNRQLHQLIDEAGGHEANPLELKIIALEKNIAEIEQEIRDTQNFWLRLQAHVVNLTEKRAQQLNDIHVGRKQLMILEQKILRIETKLDKIRASDLDNKKQMKKLNLKLEQLSSKLYQQKRSHEYQESECELYHSDLMDKLRQAEMSIVHLVQEIDEIDRKIDEHKQLAMEKHRETLSWETKWKMAVEAQKYRDQENAADSEIGLMKSEIHRMEVRLNQLKRAQDKLVQDMESCVMHRDHIFDTSKIRGKLQNTKFKLRSTFQLRLNEIKNKHKQIQNEMILAEKQLTDYLSDKEKLANHIVKLRSEIDEESLQDSLLQNEIDEAVLLKQENLENIVRTQQRAKRYRTVITAKHLPKCRNETVLMNESEKNQEINTNLISVLEGLLVEFPDHKFNIKRVLQTLKHEN